MKKYIFYILALGYSISLSSCDKFLDEQPKFSLTELNAVTNAATARAALGGVYASFQNDEWSGALYTTLATKAGFVKYGGEVIYGLSYKQTAMPSTLNSIYTQFYRTLNAANFAVKGIEGLSAAAVSEVEKDKLLAEAKCLRAWVNANILWNWCHWWADDSSEFGLIDRMEPTALTNVEVARVSVGESYKRIYDDLDFAISKLDSYTTPRFMSKEFAKVLKAKVLLYRGGYKNNTADLQQALTLVNDVLDNHPASFKMESSLDEVYNKSWDSPENLFVRYLEDDGSRTSKSGYWYRYGIIYQGNALPLPVGGSLTAGLVYGLDWFSADPRWPIVTGPVRAPETWDTANRFTFKKVARLGQYAGQQANPKDEKYAAYYFRFPELYLMKAELLARTGKSINESIAPVNQMRALRTSPVLPALNPTTQEELMDMIFKEIFVELFLENGSEFFAALRFQKNGEPWMNTIKGGMRFEENHLCFPLPDAEIVNNPKMVQNPDLK